MRRQPLRVVIHTVALAPGEVTEARYASAGGTEARATVAEVRAHVTVDPARLRRLAWIAARNAGRRCDRGPLRVVVLGPVEWGPWEPRR
jgi:hypothetical protein